MNRPRFPRLRLDSRTLTGAGLLCIWAILYLPHLRTSPGWYGDETMTHSIGIDLVRGIPAHYALWNTFWGPAPPYQPAYSALCGVFAAMAGGDLVGSRFFNALLALGAAGAIGIGGRRVLGRPGSLFAALMFLSYEQTVIHFRMVYVHNAAGLGVVLLVLGLLRPPTPANHLRAGLGLAVAAGAHPLFIHAAIGGVLARIRRPGAWPGLLGPATVVVGVTLGLVYWRFGGWLFEDLGQLRDSFSQRSAADGSGLRSVVNLGRFVFQDVFHAGAVVGLVAACRRRWRPLAIVGAVVLVLLVRHRSNLIPFYYQAVVVLPTLCLAWGVLFARAGGLLRMLPGPVRFLPRLMWVVPVAQCAVVLPAVVSGTLTPRNHFWVTQSCAEVERAAAWINERVGPEDFVVANPNIAWLLRCRTAPLLQVVTWYGLPTQSYETGNRRERFRYEASLEMARYVIIGDIDRRWALHERNVGGLALRMKAERWPEVWAEDQYSIYANPRFAPPSPSGGGLDFNEDSPHTRHSRIPWSLWKPPEANLMACSPSVRPPSLRIFGVPTSRPTTNGSIGRLGWGFPLFRMTFPGQAGMCCGVCTGIATHGSWSPACTGGSTSLCSITARALRSSGSGKRSRFQTRIGSRFWSRPVAPTAILS